MYDQLTQAQQTKLHRKSVARITATEKEWLHERQADGPGRKAFFEAKAAHEDVFGTPFKRNGQWH